MDESTAGGANLKARTSSTPIRDGSQIIGDTHGIASAVPFACGLLAFWLARSRSAFTCRGRPGHANLRVGGAGLALIAHASEISDRQLVTRGSDPH